MAGKVTNVRGGEAAAAPAPPKKETPVVNGITFVTDAEGRRYGIKKLKPSERFEVTEAVAPKTPDGELQALIAASVVSIDDEGYPLPQKRIDLLRKLDDIGDEGLKVLTPAFLKLHGVELSPEDIANAKN